MSILSEIFAATSNAIYSMTKKSLLDYSQLEGSIGTRTLTYRDETMATVVRYMGVRRIVGDDETATIIDHLASRLNQFFATGAYEIHFFMSRDEMTLDALKKRMKPMYETAARLGFDEGVNDIFDEQAATMAATTMDDHIYLVLLSKPGALRKEDYAEWVQTLIQERRKGSIHVPEGTQDETFAIEPLIALHDAVVDQTVIALTDSSVGAMCTVLSAAEAATAIAQEIDPLGTPDSWKAWLLPTTDNKQAKNATHLARRRMGEPLMTAASASIVNENPKAVRVANTAVFFPPPLKEQLISQEGTYTKDGGYLEYGGRIYATMNIDRKSTRLNYS